MKLVTLSLPENEAQDLYRLIHRTEQDHDVFCETYRQLQGYFFQTLTVEQVTDLLDRKP